MLPPTTDTPAEPKTPSSGSYASRSPQRGDFLRVSQGHRACSLSPRRTANKQPLHIRMNLTKGQVNKFTDALAEKTSLTPPRSLLREPEGPSTSRSSPQKLSSEHKQHRHDISFNSSRIFQEDVDFNTLKQWNTGSNMATDPTSSNLAERRHKLLPPALLTSRRGDTIHKLQRSRMEQMPMGVSPLTPFRHECDAGRGTGERGSYCSEMQDYRQPTPRNAGLDRFSMDNGHVPVELDELGQKWTDNCDSGVAPTIPLANRSKRRNRHREVDNGNYLNQHCDPDPEDLLAPRTYLPPPDPYRTPLVAQFQQSPLFSPLPLYFRMQGCPVVKKGEKTMIGSDGWLERTNDSAVQSKTLARKKTGILDNLRKIAKDMTEPHSYTRAGRLPNLPERQVAQLAISLSAREQSLFYCELEFHLTNTVNDYITGELDRGHLDPDKLKKISDGWIQRGRPRVIGFRYDLETQLDLVILHSKEFTFHGRRQGNLIEINGLLHTVKVNARAMGIRTFCQPDSVVAKQLVDAQSLFNLIGASNTQQISLAEVAQFFKVIVERELYAQRS